MPGVLVRGMLVTGPQLVSDCIVPVALTVMWCKVAILGILFALLPMNEIDVSPPVGCQARVGIDSWSLVLLFFPSLPLSGSSSDDIAFCSHASCGKRFRLFC